MSLNKLLGLILYQCSRGRAGLLSIWLFRGPSITMESQEISHVKDKNHYTSARLPVIWQEYETCQSSNSQYCCYYEYQYQCFYRFRYSSNWCSLNKVYRVTWDEFRRNAQLPFPTFRFRNLPYRFILTDLTYREQNRHPFRLCIIFFL